MKNRTKFLLALAASATSLFIVSCRKDAATVHSGLLSEFINASSVGKYLVTDDSNSVFKIPIGLTEATGQPRTIRFTVTSPSGAVEGQQYSLVADSIVIPANTLVDSISLKGIFSGYAAYRRDTLLFTITGGDVPGRESYTTCRVTLQQYCHANIQDFLGDYTRCTDENNSVSAPYSVSIDSMIPTGPSSATLYIRNLAAGDFGPYLRNDAAISPGIPVEFDWSDSSNLVTSIPSQQLCDSVLTYGPGTISGTLSGSYSSCDNTIKLNYTVTVGAGTFGDFTTILRR